MSKELIRVDLPSTNGRTHHFCDTHGIRNLRNRVEKSSTGTHMSVSDYVWIDPDSGKQIKESSQWGTHFDTPYRFSVNGNKYIATTFLSGLACVVDLRGELAAWSDGYAITHTVIEKWFQRNPGVSSSAWQRILLRVLSDEDARSTGPLKKFPYFTDKAAVRILLDCARGRLPLAHRTLMCCTESPSVEVNSEVKCNFFLINFSRQFSEFLL